MARYDVHTEFEYPEKTIYNDGYSNDEYCVYCRHAATGAKEAAIQIRVESWHDWDDPNPDAQGQRRYERIREWYCLDGLACARRVLAQGNNASIRALREIIASDIRRDIKDQAQQLLLAIRTADREQADALARQRDASLREAGFGVIGGPA